MLNAAFDRVIQHLISRVHLASFVIMLNKQLKYLTYAGNKYSALNMR